MIVQAISQSLGRMRERKSLGLTNLIEIKGIIAGHGAVEAGLEVRGPSVAESMWSAFVPLADTGHTGVDSLDDEEKEGTMQGRH